MIFVAGHNGMVGSAILRELASQGAEVLTRSRGELDLSDQAAVRAFFSSHRIECVYLAAAKVGGIKANATYPADFAYQNLAIAAHVIHEAWRAEVPKLLFLGSSCIYPRLAPQPMREDVLLSGHLEPTNRPYAVAKIAGLELTRGYRAQYGADYRSVMPTNLYGPHDDFSLEGSHVLPALLRKCHDAKRAGLPSITVWGTGKPRREFLHVDDLAKACVHVMNAPRDTWEAVATENYVNVGWGKDIAIAQLAALIADVTGYNGELVFDDSMPDGTPRKLLDVSLLHELGWSPAIDLETGIRQVYSWFQDHEDSLRR